jgi:hypothetical protein
MKEPDEGQLDFGVAAVAGQLARRVAERRLDEIGIAGERVEQRGLAGGLVVGHSRLHQVAGAVQLMPIAQVLPAHVGLRDDEVRVEIAIRLLRRADLSDEVVHLLPQGWVRVGSQ